LRCRDPARADSRRLSRSRARLFRSMTQPLDYARGLPVMDRDRAARATLALLGACLFWGGSFTWAKDAMTTINARAGAAAGAMMGQQLGLDRTSQAVSAFLTSLSILFVPLLMLLVLRRPPPAALWLGVALAGAGIWLMTGAAPGGFGPGELLGLCCSILFS